MYPIIGRLDVMIRCIPTSVEHVTLVAISGTTILVPYLRVPDLQMSGRDLIFKIGHQVSSPSYDHLGGMPY